MNQSDLFQTPPRNSGEASTAAAPLAHRLRPQTLAEFSGQVKIVGPGSPLRHWIETDQVPSLLFWGPPGTGKTSLARIIAKATHSSFKAMSAVLAGVKDIKEAVEQARFLRETQNRKTILFVDEIHRFNKNQQDALLPHVEDGTVTLIGATTENPSFEMNSALLSRVRVLRLDSLEPEALEQIIRRALSEKSVGLGVTLSLQDDAVTELARLADGDARRALTTLETLSLYLAKNPAAKKGPLNREDLTEILSKATLQQPIRYDKSGEEHYNVISAFIKSMRGSDPDAALYYLARMLEAGEDPLFIARRMVIFASEDIGNADPRALSVANAVREAVEFVGLPEGRINLAQGVVYLALAPKDNASYAAIEKAIAEVRESGALPVPMHLRNAVTKFMKNEGYGQGYVYAHSDPEGVKRQTHLPDAIKHKKFFDRKPKPN